MDFLGIIQWVVDVQQYPESHKEEIEKLKSECQMLSNLIQMIGQDELPSDLKSQIAKNLEEAEELLKKVPKKAGVFQGLLNMLPGQQVLQKLKDASDNIHRTGNNLNTWLNCRMYSTKVLPPSEDNDLRLSKVKKISSRDTMNNSSNQQLLGITAGESNENKIQKPVLENTLQNDNEDESDQEQATLFGEDIKQNQIRIVLELEENNSIHSLFEQFRINTRETITIPQQPKEFFTFFRQTYHQLSDTFKDVNRISREHASLELIELEQEGSNQPTLSEKKEKEKEEEQDEKEEDQFATCVEGFNDEEGQTCFQVIKKLCCVINCKGPNGIFVYRKRENKDKQEELQKYKSFPKVKSIAAGQWVGVAKGERALLFTNDSLALLKKDVITISYTFTLTEGQKA